MKIFKSIKNHPKFSALMVGLVTLGLMKESGMHRDQSHSIVLDGILFFLAFFFFGVFLFHLFLLAQFGESSEGIANVPAEQQEYLYGSAPEEEVNFTIPEGEPTFTPEQK